MTDFSLRDLASAAGFAAVVYGLFSVLVSFGSGRPVVEWINPHRRYLTSLAAALMAAAGGMIHQASARHQQTPVRLLEALVRDERAKAEVVGATTFALLAATLVVLYAYCRWFHPRDPRTFSPSATDVRAEYRRAMRHYLRWSRQMDYAALFTVEGGRVGKTVHYALPAGVLAARMRRVDSIGVSDDAPPAEAVAGQVARWDALAARCFTRWDDLDALVAPAGQGENVLIFLDLQFGGVFAEVLQEFPGGGGGKARVFLFAVCLDQAGLDSAAAARFYALLGAAIRHVRTGGAKARG